MMALDSQSGNMAGISQSGRAANLQTYAALRQGGQALQEISITAGRSSPAGNKHYGRVVKLCREKHYGRVVKPCRK
jgi:hypothetical protein